MARVEKKEKQQKNLKKPLMITGISLVSVALIVGIVFLVLHLLQGDVEAKFTESRSITANKLTDIIDVSSTEAQRYEGVIYVYVFHSDYETYSDNDLDDKTNELINNLISFDSQMNSIYKDIDMDYEGRTAFYTLDIMSEEDNEDDDFISILNNSDFGNYTGGPFLLKIERQQVTTYNTNQLYQDLYQLDSEFNNLLDTLNKE